MSLGKHGKMTQLLSFLSPRGEPVNSIQPEAYREQSILYRLFQWHLKDLDNNSVLFGGMRMLFIYGYLKLSYMTEAAEIHQS